MSQPFDPEVILSKIRNNEELTESEVRTVVQNAMDLFLEESNLLILHSPIIICGDIHGQLEDLFQLFDTTECERTSQFLFMGDYVDRGHYSIDTICYLLALKLKTRQVYLLRGNHESISINTTYGFYDECSNRFHNSNTFGLINDMFEMMPLAAVIDQKVFSVHAGLSPSLPLLESINELNRRRQIPNSGEFADLVWSDPVEDDNIWEKSQRGSGYLFGKRQTEEFLHLNDLEFMTRSHQLVREGYQWMFYRNNDTSMPMLITIWSAPNYAYVEENSASFMRYTGARPIDNQIQIFEANENRRPVQESNPSPYFA